MTEAILLVGGQGTRLRPLTIGTPKPMLPVAGVPVTTHQIARAKEAGVDHIVLGTSYRADVFTSHYGDAEGLGVRMSYAVEDAPLGTGGAIRNAAELLTCGPDDPVIVFNGDILSGLDIVGLVEGHVAADADVTIYLTRVEDPRAYGLVPTDGDGRVLAFTEKPQTPEEIVTDQINAGCYIFRRSVIDSIPLGEVVSVERQTFPGLLSAGAKVQGVVDDGYWLDLGTPLSFVKGSCDLVRGIAPSPALLQPTGHAAVLADAVVDPTATLDEGTTIGERATVFSGATVRGSVVMQDAIIGANSTVIGSIIGRGAVVGANVHLRGAVIADGAIIEDGNELLDGARVWPGVKLSATAVRFSADS